MEELKGALAEEFEVSIDEMRPEAKYVDVLGLDSLDIVDAIVLIEGVTGVKLAKGDIRKDGTFGELFETIASKK